MAQVADEIFRFQKQTFNHVQVQVHMLVGTVDWPVNYTLAVATCGLSRTLGKVCKPILTEDFLLKLSLLANLLCVGVKVGLAI
jgi:hypothetical protein